MNQFIKLLYQKRRELSFNKKQMADYLGWTPMYYGRFENGDIIPKGKNIKKFARVLCIKENELRSIIAKDKEIREER